MTKNYVRNFPPIVIALVPLAATGLFLSYAVFVLDSEPHIPLFLGIAVAAAVASLQGHSWQEIEAGITESITRAIPALLIMLIIGMIIGVWIASGVVPAIIYFAFDYLSPTWFLPLTLLFCSAVSLITGSSWTTAGTVGLAAVVVGSGMGLPAPAVAGAVVSGSFFGDKLSPLSDSTNLTSAIFNVELYTHIRQMLYSTFPALTVTLLIYTALSYYLPQGSASPEEIMRFQEAIRSTFSFSYLLLIPPVSIVAMIVLKKPAIPSLILGAALGALVQVAVQGASLAQLAETVYSGYTANTGWDVMDTLLSQGGMANMYSIVALGLLALAFGGIMEKCGMLHTIVTSLLSLVKSTGNLVVAALASALLINLFTANQYLAIIIPGQMFKESFREKGLHPKILSRAMEGGGTLTAPLIPWNSSGLFMLSVLSVSPGAYAPYAILCWLTPLIVILYGYLNITMQ